MTQLLMARFALLAALAALAAGLFYLERRAADPRTRPTGRRARD